MIRENPMPREEDLRMMREDQRAEKNQGVRKEDWMLDEED